MVQEDFERLHNFLLETEGLPEVSEEVRDLVEEQWPELVHRLVNRTVTPSAAALIGIGSAAVWGTIVGAVLVSDTIPANPESKIAFGLLNGTVRENKAGACSVDLQRRERNPPARR